LFLILDFACGPCRESRGESREKRGESGGFLNDAREAPEGLEAWLGRLAGTAAFAPLLEVPRAAQLERGYGHTLREICQQPLTWPRTAATMAASADRVRRVLAGGGISDRAGSMVLTGSGSSFFACECAAVPLQESLGVPARALPAGFVLTHPRAALPPVGPFLAVSLARSGDSPESGAAVERIAGDSRARQLLISCNGQGALAQRYGATPRENAAQDSSSRVESIVLPPETNDQSLVMTSSFTNLVLAARSLGDAASHASQRAAQLATAARTLLAERAGELAALARQAYGSAVYLGSGAMTGAAHESALKMLETNGGRVVTIADSFLGLRHGPMAAVGEDSLVVAFLSGDPVVRAYERDVLRELRRKGLGRWRLLVGAGEDIPAELAPEGEDVRLDVGPSLDDGDLALIAAVAGQLLAFFRCLHGGGRPDEPSTGVIRRVVERFAIHTHTHTHGD
jgi:tagatose-6-phosphate ketose/aldose isomerase